MDEKENKTRSNKRGVFWSWHGSGNRYRVVAVVVVCVSLLQL